MFAAVALLLTISGLFALASLNILKRNKEIAIRRVLGAGVRHLAWLLNRNYLWFLLAGAFLGALGGRIFALALLNSISKRAAETVKEEIAFMGPLKLKDIEGAQQRIIEVVRRLESEGEIETGGGEK